MIKAADPVRARRRTRGVGLERILLQRLRPAVRERSTAGQPCPTARANGGMDYMPWLLEPAAQEASPRGTRLLDVFSVHYYPQGGEFGNDTSHGHAAAAQPLDALAVGSELRGRDLDQRPGRARSRG